MSDAADIRSRLGANARIIFVSGNFNVLHPGHIRLLSFARELGGHLVVGVAPDGNEGVNVPAAMRLEAVASNRHVEAAFAMGANIEDVLRQLRPAVVVKGREHENQHNAEAVVMDEIGGQIVFSSGEMLRLALSDMDDEIDPRRTQVLPAAYMTRHGLTAEKLITTVRGFSGLRVIVIGDLILDDYIDCDPLGMSQEDPTLVVSPRQTRRFLGGAGIVAAHGQGLGAQATFLSVTGEDAGAEEAQAMLRDYGVQAHLFPDNTRPTTRKERFRAANKTLLRVSHLRQHNISKQLSDQLVAAVEERLSETDLILFSDFNYGCLPDSAVGEMTRLAQKAGVTIAADSQVSSQIGDVSRFEGMALITPTELEARLAMNERSENIVVLSENLMRKAESKNVIMTLGSDGVLIRSGSTGLPTDRIAALNSKPRDVAGAGDCLFCTAALALASGADIWSAGLLGSVAAACQVSRIGNRPLTAAEVIGVLEANAL